MDFKKQLDKCINHKFCIVGNAPTEIGKNKGNEIDQHQTVIRFNDYSLSYPKDYGKKVDVWIRAKGVITQVKKDYYDHNLIILRAISDKNLKHREVWEQREQPYVLMPIEYEVQLSKLLKTIPSTGLLFLYILKENKFIINDQNLYGFSFENNQRYFKGNQTASKHNWNNEKVFFEKYILEK